MAAKFSTSSDPSGELMLKHWVRMGQIQDSLSFRSKTSNYRLKDFKDFPYVAFDEKYEALTFDLMLIKTNSRSTW
tara:strand:+ start:276 stop:500 length:225 start_codon:yes stop_codon:yes gene_type:complete